MNRGDFVEIEKRIEWLMPERIQKLCKDQKSQFGFNRLFIIGIGKNGVDCLMQCKHITERRFGSDPKVVRYLAIGEDKLLQSAELEGSVLSENECIPIVPEDAIYKYLNNPAKLPQHALEWFDIDGLKNYSPAAPVYGLTKRQCGRVALFHNIKVLMKRIGEAIAAFSGSDKSLEIIITGNMGDAMFGGMFIDVAYILKQLFDDTGYPVKINSYLFAADTAVLFEDDQREQGNYFANTIMSKIELDKFQVYKKPFSQQYTASFPVVSDKPPFTSCFIAAADGTYRRTINGAAEKILNRMEVLFSKDDDAERIVSYNMLKPDESHDFRYLSYGIEVYEAPIGKIMSYLAVKILTKFNHALNKNNVGQQLLGQYASTVTPDAKILAMKGGEAPELDFDERINPSFSAKALRFSDEGAHDYIDNWLEKYVSSVENGAEICLDEIANSIISTCESAKAEFEKGPFYALEIIKKCLSELRVAIAKTNAVVSDMEDQVKRAQNLERTAYMKLKTALLVNKAVEQYLYELREYADCELKLRTGSILVKFYQDLTDRFNDYLENTLSKATAAFETIVVNRKSIIDAVMRDTSDISCVKDAFSASDERITVKLDKMVDDLSDAMLGSALKSSGILELNDDSEDTALATAVVTIIHKCFPSLFEMHFGELCEYLGIEDGIGSSIENAINDVEVTAPAVDNFVLNRVLCPLSTRQEDILQLRSVHKGMNYIWNGSVMKHCAIVSQIKGGVRLEKFDGYGQWENMHYAYSNDSLKKHGFHIFK